MHRAKSIESLSPVKKKRIPNADEIEYILTDEEKTPPRSPQAFSTPPRQLIPYTADDAPKSALKDANGRVY